MKLPHSHQHLNLMPLVTIFLLLISAQKSNAQCSINFLSYQSNYISEDSVSVCYNFTVENNIMLMLYSILFNLVRAVTKTFLLKKQTVLKMVVFLLC